MTTKLSTPTEQTPLPAGWRWARLGDLALIGTTNGVFKRREQFGHGSPLVNVSDLFKSMEIDLTTVERVEASENELRHYSVEPGDLFFCRSSIKREGVGWCAYVREVKEPSVFDSHIMRVRLNPQKAFFEYVAQYWQHPEVRTEVIGTHFNHDDHESGTWRRLVSLFHPSPNNAASPRG